MKQHSALHIILILVIALIAVTGCSTQKNTARNRWLHAFHSKYNIYYNGTLAYIDASLEKEQGNKDNYTEIIPLYTVGNKNSRELGKGNYDRAIEKCQKAIQRHSIKQRPEWNKSRRKTAKDIEWLNRRTKETVTMEIASRVRNGVPEVRHILDFMERVRFEGSEYFLVSNQVTLTPRSLRQSITIARWY